MDDEKGPLQIIADKLPIGPDEWICDRLAFAHEILIALDRAGYVILSRENCEHSCPFERQRKAEYWAMCREQRQIESEHEPG